ncbi:putative non-specific serine/threonine protein kinase [Helianthus annuus]|nr:putative non-specific serine/threonine protein kinase [Helianthus annuus]
MWQVWEEETEKWLDQHMTEDVDLDNLNEIVAEMVDPSPDLIVPLLKYQKQWLAWGLKQEESASRGGILAYEMRTFQVLLHMVGNLLDVSEEGRLVTFRVSLENGNDNKGWGTSRPVGDEFVNVKFDIGTGDVGFQLELAVLSMNSGVKRQQANRVKDSLSFTMRKKLVQMMQGKIWMSTNSQGYIQSTSLVLRFQIQQTFSRLMFDLGNFVDQPKSNSIFRGLQVILADDDNVNPMVTKKLLEKIGCLVTTVSSGFEC